MEFEHFEDIRQALCAKYAEVTEGKMMHSPAIHYKGSVFAFFSRKQCMVFRLGKDYPFASLGYSLEVFSPFKTKKPLAGWYETASNDKNTLLEFALSALQRIQEEKDGTERR